MALDAIHDDLDRDGWTWFRQSFQMEQEFLRTPSEYGPQVLCALIRVHLEECEVWQGIVANGLVAEGISEVTEFIVTLAFQRERLGAILAYLEGDE